MTVQTFTSGTQSTLSADFRFQNEGHARTFRTTLMTTGVAPRSEYGATSPPMAVWQCNHIVPVNVIGGGTYFSVRVLLDADQLPAAKELAFKIAPMSTP
jgi:hypothetical protein